MRKAFIIIAFLLLSVAAPAAVGADSLSAPQGKVVPMGAPVLRQLQERDSVLIADQLAYGFELRQVEEGTLIALPQWQNDGRGGVLAVRDWVIDTLNVTKGKKGQPSLLDLRGEMVITSFDEGVFELPSIMVGRMSKDGVLDTLLFDPVNLEVKTMPVDTATFVPHDIKGQIRYPVTFREVLPWMGGGVLIAGLIALAVYLIVRYRRRHDPEYVRKDPPHIIALRELDKYRGSKMWAPEKQKAFYSGVTDTLREYMASRYGISAMEMTTAEIFKEMKDTDAPQDLLKEVRELFERADFVKFAKFTASDEDNATAVPVAVRFVTSTYQAEVEEEQNAVSEASDNQEEGGQE